MDVSSKLILGHVLLPKPVVQPLIQEICQYEKHVSSACSNEVKRKFSKIINQYFYIPEVKNCKIFKERSPDCEPRFFSKTLFDEELEALWRNVLEEASINLDSSCLHILTRKRVSFNKDSKNNYHLKRDYNKNGTHPSGMWGS